MFQKPLEVLAWVSHLHGMCLEFTFCPIVFFVFGQGNRVLGLECKSRTYYIEKLWFSDKFRVFQRQPFHFNGEGV